MVQPSWLQIMNSLRFLFSFLLRFKPSEPLRNDAGNLGRQLSLDEFPSCIPREHPFKLGLRCVGLKPPEVLLTIMEGVLKVWFHSFSFLYFLRPEEKRQICNWKILNNCPMPIKTALFCQVSVMELRTLALKPFPFDTTQHWSIVHSSVKQESAFLARLLLQAELCP